MDPLQMFSVRFHFGGQFYDDGLSLIYNSGRVEMSYIDRDKLSLPEMRGLLADQISISVEDNLDFYWLFPGSVLTNGLRRLVDDKDCLHMVECITDGGVAEVYVGMYKEQGDDVVVCSAGQASAIMKDGSKKKPVISWSSSTNNKGHYATEGILQVTNQI
ncbi:hypothetical protein QOZ80_3BG0284940 [Eleusine coracana subsp. coracana]|nr:hypothetical protein QOZ80_3BG0284940 [Eleusine coracana subsp. coracana]